MTGGGAERRMSAVRQGVPLRLATARFMPPARVHWPNGFGFS